MHSYFGLPTVIWNCICVEGSWDGALLNIVCLSGLYEMNFYGVRQSSVAHIPELSDTISISKKQIENHRVREKARPLSCFLMPQQVLQACSEVEW